MDQITIREVDESVVRQLRRIAAEEGVPFEESLRLLLARAVRIRQAQRLDAEFPAPTD